jgi:cell division protease FtsH
VIVCHNNEQGSQYRYDDKELTLMERTTTADASPREGAIPADQRTSVDQALPEARAETGGSGPSGSRPARARWRQRGDKVAPPAWRVEGAPGKEQDKRGGHTNWSRFWLVLLAMLAVNWALSALLFGPAMRTTVPYTFFLTQVSSHNVGSVTATGDTIQGTFRHQVTYSPGGAAAAEPVLQFTTQRPSFADDHLFQQLEASGVTVNAEAPNQGTPLWEDLLLWFGPALLLGGLFAGLGRSGRLGGLGAMGGFGQSRAQRYDPAAANRTTFADVAGIEDVKGEVTEIVDFLRDPGRYRRLGAQIPHGVLLSGPPGTGKTLLARAVAGEAAVPFFSISASEFIEMIVGVGASRVRDLFNQAKHVAPSIIFIDELDAIGRARGGAGSSGGYDEREQTLNQILTEMDGFTGTEGVVVLAATNRPEILDPALLRPGRFDRRVTVSPPDQAGRRQILAVHTRDVPLAPGVDLGALAASTAGMVGADLKNLANEAALAAARQGHSQVTMADFTGSLEKILLGTVRGIVLSAEERERTAFHESGHALLGMLTPGADPVRKISIIPRGQALGVTFQAPQADRYSYSAQYLRGRITGALGGRAAEEVVYGDVTTGAESDLEHASEIARQMVGRWGMSPAIGPVSVLPPPGQETFLGMDGVAPATKELVDAETRRIVEECYRQAVATLGDNRDRLEQLARTLLKQETLDEHDAYAAAGIGRDPAPATFALAGTAPGSPGSP